MKLPSINSIVQSIDIPEIRNYGFELYIKREDLIHQHISGNKYRKLKYNLQKASQESHKTILTFGGAYSNHIAATAAAGKEFGFKTIGVIRGDELGNDIEKTLMQNRTLHFAHQNGMNFKFVTRSEYRTKTDENFIQRLKVEFGDFYLVPEGGTNELAIKGCEEILNKDDEKFDYICLSMGTGGTISGVINSTLEHQKVLGFPSLKGDFLKNDIKQYVNRNDNWRVISDYHFGGYGKINTKLITFINKFKRNTSIQLDPVYTGKMMYGVFDLMRKKYFNENSKILAIHTGGLQGIEGMNNFLRTKKLPLIK